MLAIYTSLIGCGTLGPLYIPEQRYPLPTQDKVQKAPAETLRVTPEAISKVTPRVLLKMTPEITPDNQATKE
tara:strand:+ start:529 stop:744 length:216 start_codon:yes stop_codon:yes gene_type:complete